MKALAPRLLLTALGAVAAATASVAPPREPNQGAVELLRDQALREDGWLEVAIRRGETGTAEFMRRLREGSERGVPRWQEAWGKLLLENGYAKEGVEWLQKAGEAGSWSAWNELGWRYVDGNGVEPNPAAAVACFQRSADAGSDEGQLGLGYCLERGFAGPIDEARVAELYRRKAGC